jgi:hypothetical protein
MAANKPMPWLTLLAISSSTDCSRFRGLTRLTIISNPAHHSGPTAGHGPVLMWGIHGRISQARPCRGGRELISVSPSSVKVGHVTLVFASRWATNWRRGWRELHRRPASAPAPLALRINAASAPIPPLSCDQVAPIRLSGNPSGIVDNLSSSYCRPRMPGESVAAGRKFLICGTLRAAHTLTRAWQMAGVTDENATFGQWRSGSCLSPDISSQWSKDSSEVGGRPGLRR